MKSDIFQVLDEILLFLGILIRNSVMGLDVTIHGNNHAHSDFKTLMVFQDWSKTKRVGIEGDVWIGSNAIILLGLTIEKRTIIAAGALVKQDFSELRIFGGKPAKLIS